MLLCLVVSECSCLAAGHPPLSHEVPLPYNCRLPNSPDSLTFNSGRCSLLPCQTPTGACSHLRHQCCVKAHTTARLSLVCPSLASPQFVAVITSCSCQHCGEHHAITGTVLSSLNQDPVVLAAVLVSGVCVSVTDEEGWFQALLPSPGDVEFHEPNHRQLTITAPPDQNHLTLTMEYIDAQVYLPQLDQSFAITLTTARHGSTQVLLESSTAVFTSPHSSQVYSGPGLVLSSTHHGLPELNSPALTMPVYTDSLRARFAIFTLISGSLSVLSDEGTPLLIKPATHLTLMVSLTINTPSQQLMSEVNKLHIFSYSDKENLWIDKGKIKPSVQSSSEHSSVLVMRSKLSVLSSMWAIGVPVGISCYLHLSSSSTTTARVSQFKPFMGLSVVFRQLVHMSSHSTACLPAVCQLGGRIASLTSQVHSPAMQYAIVLARELIFYCNSRSHISSSSSSPYYPSQQTCASSTSSIGQFKLTGFEMSSPTLPCPLHPHYYSIVPLYYRPLVTRKHCYIKVGVVSSRLQAQVRVESWLRGGVVMISEEELTNPNGGGGETSVGSLTATCLPYTCGSALTITAHQSGTGESGCVQWSVSPSLAISRHTRSSHSLLKFLDRSSLHNRVSSGLYSSSSELLSIMRCHSGLPNKISLTTTTLTNLAATFVCTSN